MTVETILLKDLPFEPKHTKKQYSLAREFLEKAKGRPTVSYNSNYALIFQNNDVNEMWCRPCHAGMSRGFTKPVANERVSLVATQIDMERGVRFRGLDGDLPKHKEDMEFFLKWFLDKSPWSRFILNKDDYTFCRDYGLILSTDIYGALLQQILVISRHFVELGSSLAFTKFKELVEEGYNPLFVFAICFGTSVTCVTPDADTPNKLFRSESTHRAFPLQTKQNLDNFIQGRIFNCDRGRYNCLVENTYRVTPSYKGCSSLFGPWDYYDGLFFIKDLLKNNTEGIKDALVSFRNKSKGSKTSKAKVPNPFGEHKPRERKPPENALLVTEVFDFFIPFIKEKGIIDCVQPT